MYDDSVYPRFWKKVDKRADNECWLWKAAKYRNGYGQFSVRQGGNRYSKMAHRVAWELTFGEIPEGQGFHGTCVCHTCDNKSCCNPSHLFLGSHIENMMDRQAKGRTVRGMMHYAHRFSTETVSAMRCLRITGGYMLSELAKMFGGHKNHISRLLRESV